MKKLYNTLVIFTIFHSVFALNSIIASENDCFPEKAFHDESENNNTFLRNTDTTESSDNDEEDEFNHFYYKKNFMYKNDENDISKEKIIENTNIFIINSNYNQSHKVGDSLMEINTYLSELNLLEVSYPELNNIPDIVRKIKINCFNDDKLKGKFSLIEEMYKKLIVEEDKSTLFELFSNIKEVNWLIIRYIKFFTFSEDEVEVKDCRYKINYEIDNYINNIRNILAKLDNQNTNNLGDIPQILQDISNGIMYDLTDKYWILDNLINTFNEGNNNMKIKNILGKIMNSITIIMNSLDYYLQM